MQRAQRFLVDLAHAGSGDRIDELDLLGNGVTRDVTALAVRSEQGGDVRLTDRMPGPQHHQRQGALSPLGIGHADHRDFADRRVLGDDVLQRQGGNPLTARLDDILDAVGYPQVAAGVDVADVTGMQVASGTAAKRSNPPVNRRARERMRVLRAWT